MALQQPWIMCSHPIYLSALSLLAYLCYALKMDSPVFKEWKNSIHLTLYWIPSVSPLRAQPRYQRAALRLFCSASLRVAVVSTRQHSPGCPCSQSTQGAPAAVPPAGVGRRQRTSAPPNPVPSCFSAELRDKALKQRPDWVTDGKDTLVWKPDGLFVNCSSGAWAGSTVPCVPPVPKLQQDLLQSAPCPGVPAELPTASAGCFPRDPEISLKSTIYFYIGFILAT